MNFVFTLFNTPSVLANIVFACAVLKFGPNQSCFTTFQDEVDSADLEIEKMEEELIFTSSKSLSSPISIEQLRLRVIDQLPGSPPPRGSKRMSEARPPTPPGASHRVKYPKTPPPTPMDTKYM